MPSEITMPQLSDTMTEGTVVKWLKKEGDKVKEGDVIAEVETDKATMEWEATESGTLAAITAQEGQKVKVGEPIAILAVSGEDVDEVRRGASSRAPAKAEKKPKPKKEEVEERKEEVPEETGEDKESDHRRMDDERTQARRDQTDRGTHPELPARPAEVTAKEPTGRIKISPLARRLAEQHDIDLSDVEGTGPGGRIIRRDVETLVKARPEPEPEARPLKPEAVPVLAERVGAGRKEVIPLTKMRTVIAGRMQASKQQVPHFYETIDADVERLVQLRERMNKQLEQQEIRLSLNDFIIKAITVALLEHPALNATFDGQQITRYGDVNLGLAVALPEGLLVPVLRNVEQMSLREIRVRTTDLYQRAQSQRLKREELTGATFTISSLGSMGIREFSAIINPPEVAILAIGVAEKRPAVVNDQLVARTMMTITISCDHRAVDGATAAEFMRTLKQLLEEPALMLA